LRQSAIDGNLVAFEEFYVGVKDISFQIWLTRSGALGLLQFVVVQHERGCSGQPI
jgi:hypothetical protein